MTLAILNDCGTQPFANDRLNMNCKGSTIWLKTALSSLGPILSGPGDLLSRKAETIVKISSLVIGSQYMLLAIEESQYFMKSFLLAGSSLALFYVSTEL